MPRAVPFSVTRKTEGFGNFAKTLHERMQRKTELNLEILTGKGYGTYGLPTLESGYATPPTRMLPFNKAKTATDTNAGVHFFIDDYQFERVWRSPRRYAELLRPFQCVLSPDFSLYADMPLAMKVWNVYRSRAIGAYWQAQGLNVVPTLQWAEPRTFDFCFAGIEPGGMVAVSTLGSAKGRLSRQMWTAGMKEAVRQLQPKTLLLYGSPIDFDFGNIKVICYGNETIERLRNHGR